jgi:putative transposase
MPRRARNLEPGNYYHLYNRGNNRQNIFFERDNYLYFLRQFRHYVADTTVQVVAYCLMPNHYHILIYLQEDSLSAAMHRFTMSYTKAINRRYQKCGSLFQGRFQTLHVGSDDYLLYLTRYIHLNPVKAGFVVKPEDWEFSSYHEYTGIRQGTLPNTDYVYERFGTQQDYRQFVESPGAKTPPSIQHLTFE